MQALQLDRSRKFTYVETGFFERWWREQEESTKSIVRQLVKEERLQFVGGGWVMNDEATCLYEDIIDQMALGL